MILYVNEGEDECRTDGQAEAEAEVHKCQC